MGDLRAGLRGCELKAVDSRASSTTNSPPLRVSHLAARLSRPARVPLMPSSTPLDFRVFAKKKTRIVIMVIIVIIVIRVTK